MKLLYEAWAANDLYDWVLAASLVAAALVVLIFARGIVRRVLSSVAKKTANHVDDFALDVFGGTKLWLLAPVTLYAGMSVLDLPPRLEGFIDIVVLIALLCQAAVWLNRLIVAWTRRQIAQHRAVDGDTVTALSLIGFAARVLVWVLILLLVLDQLQFDITALVAGLGIGGIAVALAVQNVLGDLLASLSIVLDKPFVVGDFIIVGDDLGTVEHIGIKTTRVRALSGQLIVFSNNDLLKSRVHNYKRMYQRRVEFTLDVVCQTPPDKLELIPGIIRQAIELQKKIRFDRAHLKECGAHSYVFEAVYFVLDADYNIYMDIHQAVLLHVIRAFEHDQIELAYPTQTLFIERQNTEEAKRAEPASTKEHGREPSEAPQTRRRIEGRHTGA